MLIETNKPNGSKYVFKIKAICPDCSSEDIALYRKWITSSKGHFEVNILFCFGCNTKFKTMVNI